MTVASMGADSMDLGTQATRAWYWLRHDRAGRMVFAMLLLAAAASSPALLFHPAGASVLWVVLLGLPSLLTLLAFVLLATTFLGRGATAVAVGCLVYLGVGALLLSLSFGYMDSTRQGAHLWGVVIWPTVTLTYLGPVLGWWPDHAE